MNLFDPIPKSCSRVFFALAPRSCQPESGGKRLSRVRPIPGSDPGGFRRRRSSLCWQFSFLVGEQPGDREDVQGKPFVGPAGQLLDKCLESAGIDRAEVYVTNAVKHFKWEPRGKIRLHKKPNSLEIAACRPWLEMEIAAVHPQIIVCLGATAAQEFVDLGPASFPA